MAFTKTHPKHNLETMLTPKQYNIINAINQLKQHTHVLEIKLQNFKISKTTRFLPACPPVYLSACLLACVLTCLPAITLSCNRNTAPEFSHNEGNYVRFCCFNEYYPLCHGFLLSFIT